MLILGIDTATLACSVALLQDDALLGEFTVNIRKTHSERLMPLVDTLLRETGLEREQLQAVAAAAGPGSFTGVRIGVATARGLAQGLSIPAVAISTLEALAEAVAAPGALICPLLDARRSQVYTALYRHESNSSRGLELLIPPAATDLAPFTDRLKELNQTVIFTGEGLNTYAGYLTEVLGDQAALPEAPLRISRAGFVAICAARRLREHPEPSYREMLPLYLRRPEAERLLEKQERSNRCS